LRASGFLKHIVRNIVGVFAGGGKGNLDRAAFEARLYRDVPRPPAPPLPREGCF
jgi:hypothetical protein